MKPFTDILREARRGVIVDRLTDDLAALVKAVDATNRGGVFDPDHSGQA